MKRCVMLLAVLVLGFGVSTDAQPKPTTAPAKPPTVVFLVDATGSMMKDFDLARMDIRKRVSALTQGQKFNVFFHHDADVLGIQKPLLVFDDAAKQQVLNFIDNFAARGPGDPLKAFKVAASLHPDVIYWISDGDAGVDPANPAKFMDAIRAANPAKIKVNCVFVGEGLGSFDANLMANVAAEFKGECTDLEGKQIKANPLSGAVGKVKPPVKIEP